MMHEYLVTFERPAYVIDMMRKYGEELSKVDTGIMPAISAEEAADIFRELGVVVLSVRKEN